jgi:hypothetical protein
MKKSIDLIYYHRDDWSDLLSWQNWLIWSLSVTEIDWSDLLLWQNWLIWSLSVTEINLIYYHDRIDWSDHCLSLKLIDLIYYHRKSINLIIVCHWDWFSLLSQRNYHCHSSNWIFLVYLKKNSEKDFLRMSLTSF